jgi:hypothetical protein
MVTAPTSTAESPALCGAFVALGGARQRLGSRAP